MEDLRRNLNEYYYVNTQSYWFFSFGYFAYDQLSSYKNPNP